MAWKESESVRTWIQGLEKRTRENYLARFPRFLEFVRMSPDEMIRERMKDLTSPDPRIRFRFEQKVLAFQDMLKKDYKGYSLHDFSKCAMSFFSRNRLPLVFRKGEIEGGKPSRHEWIPTNAQVRMLYSICNLRDKIGLLLAYQCGLNPIDIEDLDIEKMPIYDENGQIQTTEHKYFEVYRSKTGCFTQTCLSNELLHDIDFYLKSRNNPKSGPLLISHKGDRLKGEDLNTSLRETARVALGDKFQFKITLLRKAYQGSLDNTPTISKNYSELMMGHSLGIGMHYSKPSEMEIKTAYDQVFPRLSINGHVQAREDIKEMRQDMTGMKGALDLVMGTLRKMVEKEIGQQGYQIPTTGIGLATKPTDKEVLEKYIKS